MKNSIKVLIAGVSLVLLAGCANTKAVTSQDAYYKSTEVVSNSKLSNNIQVEAEGFRETSKNLFSENRTSSINNSEAKKAIEESLKTAGLFSQEGSYVLKASLLDSDLAGFWGQKTEEREISINFLLEDSYNNVIYNKDIVGKGENEIGFISLQWKEEHIVATRAYRDAFRQLIEDLKDI